MNEIVLSTESPSIQHLCACDKRFAKVYSMVGSITYSLYEELKDKLISEYEYSLIKFFRNLLLITDDLLYYN